MTSRPLPPAARSRPRPVATESFPPPPLTLSLPPPVLARSRPPPSDTRSFPRPGQMKSRPPEPMILSSPPSPTATCPFFPPSLILSAFSVPTTVARFPAHGGAFLPLPPGAASTVPAIQASATVKAMVVLARTRRILCKRRSISV